MPTRDFFITIAFTIKTNDKERSSDMIEANVGNGRIYRPPRGRYRAVPCPVCGKRVFDVTGLPDEPVRVSIKCPHCRNIVDIPICAVWKI